MANKTTKTTVNPMSIEEVMEMLRNEPAAKKAVAKKAVAKSAPLNLDVGGFIADKVADSGIVFGRIAEGASAARDNFNDARKMEKERQLRRRAERIVAFAS